MFQQKEKADWRATSIANIEVSTKGVIKVGRICFQRGLEGLDAASQLAKHAESLKRDKTFLTFCSTREAREMAFFRETVDALSKSYPSMPKSDLESLAWLKVKSK